TWDNGLSAEYTPKQLQAWNYKKSEPKFMFASPFAVHLGSWQLLVILAGGRVLATFGDLGWGKAEGRGQRAEGRKE
ncbi:hypothetical protein VB693_24450, partial [Anabaena sp. UHCC 0399]|nr:hypothetical protein [Anabaena sp. UHCC 0399]